VDGHSEGSEIAFSTLTSRLRSLDYVWRPLQLKPQDLLLRNIRRLNNQLKSATPFIKFVNKTFKSHELESGEQMHCSAMLYNKFQVEDVRSRSAEDEYEMDNFEEEEQSCPTQITAVLAIRSTNEGEIKEATMVLKAPDSVQTFTKESLVNTLDMAETMGCHKVIVAINKQLPDRVNLAKAFLLVGFEMVHPTVLSVDNHMVLSYEL
jgi:soluble cytochrome b562